MATTPLGKRENQNHIILVKIKKREQKKKKDHGDNSLKEELFGKASARGI